MHSTVSLFEHCYWISCIYCLFLPLQQWSRQRKQKKWTKESSLCDHKSLEPTVELTAIFYSASLPLSQSNKKHGTDAFMWLSYYMWYLFSLFELMCFLLRFSLLLLLLLLLLLFRHCHQWLCDWLHPHLICSLFILILSSFNSCVCQRVFRSVCLFLCQLTSWRIQVNCTCERTRWLWVG